MPSTPRASRIPPLTPLRQWFAGRGWKPFRFQTQAWAAWLRGESGLLHAPTGMGKTYAMWGGPLLSWMHEAGRAAAEAFPMDASPRGTRRREDAPGLRVLWITPLRALANDTAQSLELPVRELGLPWTIELRTGDTPSSLKTKQRRRLPTCLITTPESLTLLLSYPDAQPAFAQLEGVIVDEWHELMGSKRGVQTELALARLRSFRPGLRTWGLSATLGNLEQARDVLMGVETGKPRPGALIHAPSDKTVEVASLAPTAIERFPWAGHLGTKLAAEVLDRVQQGGTTLLFTNTRSQAELWRHALVTARPDLDDLIALHHGSLDRAARADIEARLRAGDLRAAVCTSSLDLGVDFAPVDQVMQLGSPKGVARLMQRAGRSGHQPGATSRVWCVPTHAFELIEFAAARDALAAGNIEARPPVEMPFDVLVQHLVTMAMADGFDEAALLDEVRSTWAFRELSDEAWGWAMAFVERGGEALAAYPQYQRIRRQDGRFHVSTPQIARMHRLQIGTITADATFRIAWMSGRTLGTVEERFVSRLKPGDRFLFAGRTLELVRVRQTTAFVRPAKGKRGMVPRWAGTRFPLSTQLARAVLERFAQARAGRFEGPEMRALRPLLELQARQSALPVEGELLIERTVTDEGEHTYLYPFAGRLAHEGVGALLAHRLAQESPRTVTFNVNDYGIEILSPEPLGLDGAGWIALLTCDRLLDDLLHCLNATQMARSQFREIARVAGLVFVGYPSDHKGARQLQASSDLFFDVFEEFDPDNLLLEQARREVLDQQLEVRRLCDALERIERLTARYIATDWLTPLAFPLYADRLREEQVSTESWTQRIERIVSRLESQSG